MDNSVCKGVLIALIVVAALLCIWILTSVFRCLFYGAACTQACCCCCSKGLGGRQNYPPQYYEKPSQLVYDNPNMYGAHQMPLYQQPQQQPPVYQGATPYYPSKQGYEPVYPSDENPYDRHQYRGAF